MADIVQLAGRVTSLEVSPAFESYTKVIIHISDEEAIEVGNDIGRTLEIDNPFGTQEIAQNILDSLVGYQYQPYKADGAILNPAAEIGDGANMLGNYGGIYSRSRDFGTLMKADIAAPCDEEINHEYEYESPEDRQFTRQINEVKASLIIKANEILAEVVAKEDGEQSSFGWSLLSNSWKVYSNGMTVLSVDANGLEVAGTIKAGTQVGGNNGFVISASAIYNNIQSMDSTLDSGVYIGTDGIRLGSNFRVDNGGNVNANNVTLTGTLTIGGTGITANALRSGAQSAYTNGGAWTRGAGYGDNYNAATKSSGGTYPGFYRAQSLYCSSLRVSSMVVGSNPSRDLRWRYMQAADGNYYYFLCGS